MGHPPSGMMIFLFAATLPFYDQEGIEEYDFVSGTLAVFEHIFPVSSIPFSVIRGDWIFHSKTKVALCC